MVTNINQHNASNSSLQRTFPFGVWMLSEHIVDWTEHFIHALTASIQNLIPQSNTIMKLYSIQHTVYIPEHSLFPYWSLHKEIEFSQRPGESGSTVLRHMHVM